MGAWGYDIRNPLQEEAIPGRPFMTLNKLQQMGLLACSDVTSVFCFDSEVRPFNKTHKLT